MGTARTFEIDACRRECQFSFLHFFAVIAPALRSLRLNVLCFCLAVHVAVAISAAQSSTGTVRHHRIQEEDPAAALLSQAEADIEKEDYAAADPLLRKYLDTYPESYAAWYDLGYGAHALGKQDGTIAAYRRAAAAQADVFESNLNLGLSLA